jgi:hypothetical protein
LENERRMDSMEVLAKNLKIASGFMQISQEDKDTLLRKSETLAENARYEWYKR